MTATEYRSAGDAEAGNGCGSGCVRQGIRRLGTEVAADLITRAGRYRALAAGVTDEQTRAGLLELAEKYEALAGEMKGDDPPEA
jgi:hypothetical protein